MENFYVYQTKKKRSNYIRQTDVRQKSKKISFWCDPELHNHIECLEKELNHTTSKIIKDILEDFFLEKKLRDQKEKDSDWRKEVSEW